jgi:predicted RND superfamily exporter protein
MKKRIKYGGIVFVIISSCLVFLFIYNLKGVKVDNKIKEKVIKNLKTKKKISFLNDRKPVSTDFSLVKNNTDTVYWQCNINEWEKLKSVQEINFHIGDGFSGKNINIIKLSNKYKIFIEDFSDNNNIHPKKYYIENQNLILDKKNYNKGDSIFGKIDFTIKEKIDKEYSIYYARGYFKGRIN